MALGSSSETAGDENGEGIAYGATNDEHNHPLLDQFSYEKPVTKRRDMKRVALIIGGLVVLIKLMLLLSAWQSHK
eukprot:1835202-Rhodomonas_salina.1